VERADLVDRVRAALKRTRRLEEKKMFGGTAFLVRGRICVSARKERIMCRIDPAFHDAAVRRRGCETMVMKGHEYRGYVRVAGTALRTTRELDYWIRLALEYNRTLK